MLLIISYLSSSVFNYIIAYNNILKVFLLKYKYYHIKLSYLVLYFFQFFFSLNNIKFIIKRLNLKQSDLNDFLCFLI